MTKTLLVNCSLKAGNDQLRKALRKFSECNVIHFKDINEAYHLQEGVDVIVVSGSGARIVDTFYQVMFQGLTNFVKGCELPLLGICYGINLSVGHLERKWGLCLSKSLIALKTFKLLLPMGCLMDLKKDKR